MGKRVGIRGSTLVLLVAVWTAACGSDSPRATPWRIAFASSTQRARAIGAELTVREGGCSGSVVWRSTIRGEGGDGSMPPALGPGTYCLSGRALSEECTWFLRGEQRVQLPLEAEEEARLVLAEPIAPERRCSGEACGPCSADGGGVPTGDAGTRDGGALDAGFRPLTDRVFDRVAVGASHTCMLAEGAVTCIGDDEAGQLGTEADREGMVFADVGAGGAHSCAVTEADGTDPPRVVCWGANEEGQLGVVPGEETARPNPITWHPDSSPPPTPRRVWLGLLHSVLSTTTGAIAAWGDNDQRQARPGIGAPEDLGELYEQAALLAFVSGSYEAVSVGAYHSCGLHVVSRHVRCWGDNRFGQLGIEACVQAECPNTTHRYDGPFRAVGVGRAHTCVIEEQGGDVFCWGAGDAGQRGGGVREEEPVIEPQRVETPVPLGNLGRSLGDTQCGWNDAGAVVCWGDNSAGQAAPNTAATVVAPTRVWLPAPARFVESGVDHTCALLETGHVRCWGSDASGKIGELSLYP